MSWARLCGFSRKYRSASLSESSRGTCLAGRDGGTECGTGGRVGMAVMDGRVSLECAVFHVASSGKSANNARDHDGYSHVWRTQRPHCCFLALKGPPPNKARGFQPRETRAQAMQRPEGTPETCALTTPPGVPSGHNLTLACVPGIKIPGFVPSCFQHGRPEKPPGKNLALSIRSPLRQCSLVLAGGWCPLPDRSGGTRWCGG